LLMLIIVSVGRLWGIVFDRVKERSFAERMREDPSVIPECLQALARLHAGIHSQPARQFGNLKARLATNIAGIEILDEPLRQNLLGRLADMPEGDRLCHGDFHPINGPISTRTAISQDAARKHTRLAALRRGGRTGGGRP